MGDAITLQAFYALVRLVQIVGLIAVIRGLLILMRLSGQAQPGTFGRAMTHIVGGTLAMNIVGFNQIVFNSFGI